MSLRIAFPAFFTSFNFLLLFNFAFASWIRRAKHQRNGWWRRSLFWLQTLLLFGLMFSWIFCGLFLDELSLPQLNSRRLLMCRCTWTYGECIHNMNCFKYFVRWFLLFILSYSWSDYSATHFSFTYKEFLWNRNVWLGLKKTGIDDNRGEQEARKPAFWKSHSSEDLRAGFNRECNSRSREWLIKFFSWLNLWSLELKQQAMSLIESQKVLKQVASWMKRFFLIKQRFEWIKC